MKLVFFGSRKTSNICSDSSFHFSCVARHAQITRNNKFVFSLEYLQKEVSDEVDFLHAEKYESMVQIDANW